MKISTLISSLAVSAFLSIGAAYAIDAAPAPAKPAAAPMAAPMAAGTTHSAKSIECSKEADAKGLHGKERKKFREECKKGK